MGRFIDLTGQRFGRLTVIERAPRDHRYRGAMWRCRCDCGCESIAESHNLRSGNTTSCGCYHRERQKAGKSHGMSKARLYRIWKAMHTRCYNPNSPAFKYYGGRGITICDEWLRDFEAFHRWSVANGYAEDLTIDRIDVNGSYCPENCRFVSMAEQNKNKRVPNGCRIKEEI